MAFGCWLISWALSWALASLFLKPAMKLSDALYNQTIVQLGVPGLLMAYSGVVAFWNITFGRTSRGWGEIAASTVIGALAVSTFAAPPQLLLGQQDGAVGKARDLGIAIYAITTGHEDALSKAGQITEPKARELTRTVTDGIVEAFVVRPAFLLSYNQQLSDKCVDLYSDSRVTQAFFNEQVDKTKELIQKNPSGFGWVPNPVQGLPDALTDKATDYVANDLLGLNPNSDFEKACVKDAGAAKRTGWDKVGGALFIFIAAVLMTVLLLMTAFFYLSTQMRLVIEAVLARVALAAGIMPGPGRAWLWERATNIVRLLGLLVALVTGLAIAVTLVTALLTAPFGDNAGALARPVRRGRRRRHRLLQVPQAHHPAVQGLGHERPHPPGGQPARRQRPRRDEPGRGPQAVARRDAGHHRPDDRRDLRDRRGSRRRRRGRGRSLADVAGRARVHVTGRTPGRPHGCARHRRHGQGRHQGCRRRCESRVRGRQVRA